MADFIYIDTPAALEDLCQTLRKYPWMALDTEFIREKTYNPKLCLLQVANPDVVACVDPLALPDLGSLLELLTSPDIVKVLHAARQDLEIFHGLCSQAPAPVFDTQVAATLLGYGDQIGYAALVAGELGVHLDKGHARTDWCQRPLDGDQLIYAADDVRYLRDVYLRQKERLTLLGREEWLEEDFAQLSDNRLYENDPADAWHRIKGAGRLKGRQLAVLAALAAWRERQARQLDRPRRWIVKDDAVLDIARLSPQTPDHLSRIRGLDEGFVRKFGAAVLTVVREASKQPKSEWPILEEGPRLPVEQESLVDLLAALLKERCRECEVSPTAIASRRELERLILGDRHLPLLRGWRRAMVGEELLALLDGQCTLKVIDGRLAVLPSVTERAQLAAS